MKQKKINNILYVFDTTPYVITEDTDAEIIKVQEESFNGFVELNPSLADKFVKFNYKIFCVNTQEWMPYINEPDDDKYNIRTQGDAVQYVTFNPADMKQEAGLFVEIFPEDDFDNTNIEISSNVDIEIQWAEEYEGKPAHWFFVMPNNDILLQIMLIHVELPHIYFDSDAYIFSQGKIGGTINSDIDTTTYNIAADGGEEMSQQQIPAGTLVRLFAATTDQDNNPIEVDPTTIHFGGGVPVELQWVPANESYNSLAFWYFEMPDQNVNIQYLAGPLVVRFWEYSQASNDVEIDNPQEYYSPGAEVTINVLNGKTTDDINLHSDWVPAFTPNNDKNAWTFEVPLAHVVIAAMPNSPHVNLTVPHGLQILTEGPNSWVYTTEDPNDNTKDVGEVYEGQTYSVEQRSGAGHDATVSMNPNYLTGNQGTVGAEFTIPSSASDCEITLTPIVKYQVTFSNDSDAAGDVRLNPADGYQEAGQFFEIFPENGKTGEDIEVTSNDVSVSYSPDEPGVQAEHWYFNMPASNVEISVKYKTPL